MTSGLGDPFDRHVFACAIAVAIAEARCPVTEALGLAPAVLADLVNAYFPDAALSLAEHEWGSGPGEDQLEEPDLRQLLIEHRSNGEPEEEWLAAIVARRSLGANHLWQDLGLFNRGDLSTLMDRHFTGLKRLNSGDMKWKKFFYRQLCERDGVAICKSPNCDVCDDVDLCFGPEAGEPLSNMRTSVLDIRQKRRSD